MNVNFIVSDDIQQTLKRNSRMVQIKCAYCNNTNLISNHVSGITDYIESDSKLHACICGIQTKIHPEEISEIKRIIGINQN
jgi:hypothetical protein